MVHYDLIDLTHPIAGNRRLQPVGQQVPEQKLFRQLRHKLERAREFARLDLSFSDAESSRILLVSARRLAVLGLIPRDALRGPFAPEVGVAVAQTLPELTTTSLFG
jgi:hypothetical protein